MNKLIRNNLQLLFLIIVACCLPAAKSFDPDNYTRVIDPRVTEYIERVAQNMGEVIGFQNFEVHVVAYSELKAAAHLIKNRVYISTGKLKFVENEDQLAGVLAHEITHLAKQHTLHKDKHALGFYSTAWAVAVAALLHSVMTYGNSDSDVSRRDLLRYGGALMTYVATIEPAALLYRNTVSRPFEKEANLLAAHYLHKAGYDVNNFVQYWKNLQANPLYNWPAVGTLIHSHYSPRQVVEMLQQYIDQHLTSSRPQSPANNTQFTAMQSCLDILSNLKTVKVQAQ